MNYEHNIPLPRLLNASGGTERTIHPVSVSINLAIEPLSDATMTLPQGESLPARGYVELYTCMGSAGIFRVRSPQDAYGMVTTTAELEHAIVEVGDFLVKTEISEMMAANTAITTIFSHYTQSGGSKWQLGNITAIGSGNVAVQVSYERVLDALLAILDQKPDCMMSFDFSTSPWTLNIVAKGTTVSAEGRLARNVNYAKVTYDDTELCTRVYYQRQTTTDSTSGIDTTGISIFSVNENYSKETYVIYSDNKIYYLPNGHVAGTTWANTTKTLKNDIPTSEWVYVDADTISTYGRIEKSISMGSDYTTSEALTVAQEYLRRHKEPRVSVEISASELSHITGESFDSFDIGKLYRLALSDYNITIEKNVTGLYFQNVYGMPDKITVYLAQEEDTAISFLHDVDAKGGTDAGSGGMSSIGGGRGGGGGNKSQIIRLQDYYTKLARDAYHYNLVAAHVNEVDRVLEMAGLYIDSEGVIVYAQDNVHNIGSRMQADEDKIGLVVEGNGPNATIKAAEIWASIDTDLRESHITISADVIDIDGIVAGLVAKDITVGDITGQGSCDIDQNLTVGGYVSALEGTFDYLNVNSESATWHTKTVVTSVGTTSFTKNFRLADGTTWSHTVVTDVGYNTSTIAYLGD